MENKLNILREDKISIKKQLDGTKDKEYLHKLKVASTIREILCDKYPRISEVIVDGDIKIYFKRTNVSTLTISIRNYNPYTTVYSFIPALSWDSISINKDSAYMIEYLNIVHFLANELVKTDSEFFSYVINSMNEINNLNLQVTNLEKKLNQIVFEINSIEYNIKKDLFNSKLQNGNFYYLHKVQYGRSVYVMYYIHKINPKTVTVSKMVSAGEDTIFDNLERGYTSTLRIRVDELFDILKDYTLTNREEFKDIVLNNKFRVAIESLSKARGLSFLRDIKGLCKALKEVGVTTVNVPDNDTLSIISKWIHLTQEKKRKVI